MKAGGYSAGMTNRVIVLLKFIFNLALKWKIPGVEINPAVGVKLFQTNHRERFLTVEETQRLLKAIQGSNNTQLKYIVPLLLLLGCRKQELLRQPLGGLRPGTSDLAQVKAIFRWRF